MNQSGKKHGTCLYIFYAYYTKSIYLYIYLSIYKYIYISIYSSISISINYMFYLVVVMTTAPLVLFTKIILGIADDFRIRNTHQLITSPADHWSADHLSADQEHSLFTIQPLTLLFTIYKLIVICWLYFAMCFLWSVIVHISKLQCVH